MICAPKIGQCFFLLFCKLRYFKRHGAPHLSHHSSLPNLLSSSPPLPLPAHLSHPQPSDLHVAQRVRCNMPSAVKPPRTLYDKVFEDHIVDEKDDGTILLYIGMSAFGNPDILLFADWP